MSCSDVDPGDHDEATAERITAVCKALSDPVRVRLYLAIAGAPDEVCVCALPDVGVSQPTVSHHLRILRSAGLVVGERRGTWVHYRAVPGATDPLHALAGTGAAHVLGSRPIV